MGRIVKIKSGTGNKTFIRSLLNPSQFKPNHVRRSPEHIRLLKHLREMESEVAKLQKVQTLSAKELGDKDEYIDFLKSSVKGFREESSRISRSNDLSVKLLTGANMLQKKELDEIYRLYDRSLLDSRREKEKNKKLQSELTKLQEQIKDKNSELIEKDKKIEAQITVLKQHRREITYKKHEIEKLHEGLEMALGVTSGDFKFDNPNTILISGALNLTRPIFDSILVLLVSIEGRDSWKGIARYDNFVVGSYDEGYPIRSLGTYTGNAGDCLRPHERQRIVNYRSANKTYKWWGYQDEPHCNLLGEYVYMNGNDVSGYNFWWGNRIAVKKCQLFIHKYV
ncbi:uncharacterized protein Dana_GF24583 [Drosophila ananassae]|uniref:Fibrinogen C-terminal domain-containing protein n=1 Tax=Drosophila ananassae TaxID=7217 RepID=B3M3J8_DROAN|nr:uncharacterized protein LOC6507215 isoform X2 [Drosophila ananassae]EDV39259.2 uncharacterized protein Dana_GF24583 [Drosophila ananassae]